VGPGRSTAEVPADVLDRVRVMQRRAFEIQLPWGDLDEVEPDPPVLDRLSSVAAPTQVLIGGHDLETSKDAARRVCDGIPGATRVDWPDVAHLPSMERPHDFLELLLDWVAAT
jgi:pimeloyl-ACP methyl ester carboxylesterase